MPTSAILSWVLTLFVLALPVGASPTESSGKIVGIADGDTIEVLHNQYPEPIRLRGIDCPEKGQPYGKRAKPMTFCHLLGPHCGTLPSQLLLN
jgi:endonuclease YncB( thermonuclease family)